MAAYEIPVDLGAEAGRFAQMHMAVSDLRPLRVHSVPSRIVVGAAVRLDAEARILKRQAQVSMQLRRLMRREADVVLLGQRR